MKPAVQLIAALGLWMMTAAGQSPPEAVRVERLTALGKLWAAAKYFHPSLAYRDINWDAALVAAWPKAAAATTAAEYREAVQSMLSVLGDPATRVLPAPASAPPRSELTRKAEGGILVVTLNPATAPNGQAARLAAEIAQARGVVFDLRHQEAWAGGESSTVGLVFVSAGLNSQLAHGVLKAPGQRSRIHSGLASLSEGGSVYYHSAFYVRDGAVIAGAGKDQGKPVVFLVDRSSNLPPIAPALQAAGRAKIVAAGGATDAALVERNRITLPDGVQVELRTTELVYEDGTTGLAPDLVAPEDGNQPLEAALRLARSPGSAPTVARPKLPPYGVPRREEAYATPEYPSREHRMLAAFRIWAAFEYFFAYRSLMEDDWGQVLTEFLPRLERAADAREYALALAEMLSHTRDSHVRLSGSRAFDEFLGVASPPVETRMIEGLPVVTYAAAGTELKPGDVILRVDGEEAGARLARLGRYFAASTRQSLASVLMATWLNGPLGSTAALTIRDREVRLNRTETGRRRTRAGEAVRILAANIGYADLERVAPADVDTMFQKLKDTKAIVFDMRGYPQGTAWLIAPRLTDRRQVVAARFRRPLALAPPGISGDVSTLGAAWDFVQYIPDSSAWKYRGQTVMLLDERAMSQAEHMGLFLEAANGTKFVGTASAGANGDVARFTIPGGITISFSGHDIRHADGRQLQRVGLTPDVEARPTIAGIRAGRDEVLEKALDYLSGTRLMSGGVYADSYSERLKGLDSQQPESVCEARATLRAWMPQAGSADRAAMFRAFSAHYSASLRTTSRGFTTAMRPFERDILDWLSKGGSPEAAVKALLAGRPNIRQVAARWLDCGFLVVASEGQIYPGRDPNALVEFTPFLPSDLQEYVRFRAREDAEAVVADAALQLSWEQLRERLARWETFARRYPQLAETQSKVQPEIHRLAGFLFLGVDNTPTYDYGTGRIEPELVASWDRLAALDRESQYQELAAVLTPRVKASGGRISAEDRALFERYGLGDEFDRWWRTLQLHTKRPR